MKHTIVNDEAAKLAYEIAGYSHKPVEEVIAQAMREFAARVLRHPVDSGYGLPLSERIARIQERVAALPVLDSNSAETIVGYDENGLLPQ